MTDETLGSMKISFGIDEKGFFIYYYDLWNIQPKMNSDFDLEIVSKPPEIYDRYYLSSEDWRKLEESGIDIKKLKIQIAKNTKKPVKNVFITKIIDNQINQFQSQNQFCPNKVLARCPDSSPKTPNN